ncbi:hypothetical protein HMPREF9607_02525 [Cutibacterium modestum HL044PA1]|uniref:Uncharacterized protein n=1 Tax=Cutibacterium modestum HL044PA1 TaxID=765109 RepID=A0ABP2K5M3_9ACTN|nr:hypothetical protein HMPREF9607_02525 [Cutibacterium modestum HL044PA1]
MKSASGIGIPEVPCRGLLFQDPTLLPWLHTERSVSRWVQGHQDDLE